MSASDCFFHTSILTPILSPAMLAPKSLLVWEGLSELKKRREIIEIKEGMIHSVCSRVSDPDSLKQNPDPDFLIDPDPGFSDVEFFQI